MRDRFIYSAETVSQVGTQVSVQGNAVGLNELKVGSGSSTMTGKMVVLTGGVEMMSQVPMSGYHTRLDPAMRQVR